MHINLNEEQVDKALFDALYALMQRRTIEELTVGDILEQAHVSRSSFYRHYRDKYELLTTSYKHILESTYLRCLHGSPWKKSATSLYTVLAEHPAFFKHALASTGPNSLRQYICDISMECYEEIFRQHGQDLRGDWRLFTAVKSHIYGTCEITCEWAQEGMRHSPQEMIDLFYYVTPDCLKPYCS